MNNKKLKRRVRAEMERSGVPYTAARRSVIAARVESPALSPQSFTPERPPAIPVLDAYVWPTSGGRGHVQSYVWCAFCYKWHTHGTSEGQRVAHCIPRRDRDPAESPYRSTGYELRRIQGVSLEAMVARLLQSALHDRDEPSYAINEVAARFGWPNRSMSAILRRKKKTLLVARRNAPLRFNESALRLFSLLECHELWEEYGAPVREALAGTETGSPAPGRRRVVPKRELPLLEDAAFMEKLGRAAFKAGFDLELLELVEEELIDGEHVLRIRSPFIPDIPTLCAGLYRRDTLKEMVSKLELDVVWWPTRRGQLTCMFDIRVNKERVDPESYRCPPADGERSFGFEQVHAEEITKRVLPSRRVARVIGRRAAKRS